MVNTVTSPLVFHFNLKIGLNIKGQQREDLSKDILQCGFFLSFAYFEKSKLLWVKGTSKFNVIFWY